MLLRLRCRRTRACLGEQANQRCDSGIPSTRLVTCTVAMQCPERMEGSQMGSPNVGSRLGTQFGPYELQSLIGVGGMGEVYRAYDTVRERMVAIKGLRTDLVGDASFQQRFRRESRVAARLQEP